MKIAEIRQIPATIEKTTLIAALALAVSVVALIVALGAKNAG